MSAGTAAAVSLSILAGLAGAIQVAVMGELGERAGILAAVALSTVFSVTAAAVALLVARENPVAVVDALREPPWLWIGGLLSIFIVFSMTVAGPRIGTVATVAIVIAGNLAMAAAIDRFGLFGLERIELAWPRVLGLVLLAAGAALSLYKA